MTAAESRDAALVELEAARSAARRQARLDLNVVSHRYHAARQLAEEELALLRQIIRDGHAAGMTELDLTVAARVSRPTVRKALGKR